MNFVNGTRIRAHPQHVSSALVLYMGMPDFDEMSFLRDYIVPGDLVIDVGANIGIYAVLAASLTRDGRVLAFEPDPGARLELQRNLAVNHLHNVEIRGEAVGDRHAEVFFSEGMDVLNRVLGEVAEDGARRIQMITLDEACDSQLPPSVIKVDTEGTGCDVLKGAARLLSQEHAAVWIMEIDNIVQLTDHSELDRQPVIEAMRTLGYSAYGYNANEHRLCAPRLPTTTHNLLFVRDDDLQQVCLQLTAGRKVTGSDSFGQSLGDEANHMKSE